MTWHTNEFQTQLDHLIKLAEQPGWRAQAWNTAKKLSQDQSGLYKNIDQALIEAMAGLGAKSGRLK